MSVEKTFTEFMIIHEKKLMSKDVNSLESGIIDTTERSSAILGEDVSEELQNATKKMMEGLSMFKKVLAKHQLYEIK